MKISSNDLIQDLRSNQELLKDFQQDPVQAINNYSQRVLDTDPWIYRIVVMSLGFSVIGCVIGAVLLSCFAKPIPEILIAMGSAAVGALAGLLSPTPAGK